MDKLPESLHFVGVVGIGMSGLAQMARSLGRKVSGSDRALDAPENARIVESLRAQGVELFPQDGSRHSAGTPPGVIVYSTAIEGDNPDFLKAPPSIPRIHRSEALSLCVGALSGSDVFAVTGTCGKTSVSAWLAEALENAGESPSFLGGGLANRFRHDGWAGNFRSGSGRICVLEADESDKSLLNYSSDYAAILNIGTDHYPKEELARLFREFLRNVRKGAVIEDAAFMAIEPESVKHLDIALFSTDPKAPDEICGRRVFRLDSYSVKGGIAFAGIDGMREIVLPAPGLYTAANALASYSCLRLLGHPADESLEAVSKFSGVWRRFDCAGRTSSGATVYDDYAHNVEKIVSCIKAAHEICPGKLAAFFQPHGFGPLDFMREELFKALEEALRPDDVFCFLPVYYAGGSSSFTPSSKEVADDYAAKGCRRYLSFESRSVAERFVMAELKEGDLALVMGARDNSLSTWACEGFAAKPVE